MACTLSSAVLCLGCAPPSDEGAQAERPIERLPTELIAFENVSIQTSDETASSSLNAASLVYRSRRGAAGFITYHDLAELFATDATLSIELRSQDGFASIPETMATLLAPGVDESATQDGAVAELGAKKPAPTSSNRVAGGNWPVVTRFLFERLAVHRMAPGAELSLEARYARHDVDSGTLVLDGDVVLRTSHGEEIRSPKAVLSREHDGLYLPLGHYRHERHEPRSVFVVLNDEGELSATSGRGRISYEDWIEQRERLVITHYAKRAPPSLRPLLIAILSGMSSRPR